MQDLRADTQQAPKPGAEANASEPESGQRSRPTLEVIKTLWPPTAGTVRLRRIYGDALVCVRYRRDPVQLRRLTTVELIVSEGPIDFALSGPRRRFEVETLPVEQDLRTALIRRGARWLPERERWLVPGTVIAELELADRVRLAR